MEVRRSGWLRTPLLSEIRQGMEADSKDKLLCTTPFYVPRDII